MDLITQVNRENEQLNAFSNDKGNNQMSKREKYKIVGYFKKIVSDGCSSELVSQRHEHVTRHFFFAMLLLRLPVTLDFTIIISN